MSNYERYRERLTVRRIASEVESEVFDPDAILKAAESDLYNSTMSDAWDELTPVDFSSYCASAQIALSLDW